MSDTVTTARGITETKTKTKTRGTRSADTEIVAQSDILKIMLKQQIQIERILSRLDAATKDRVLMWMDARFGKAAQVGEYEEKE